MLLGWQHPEIYCWMLCITIRKVLHSRARCHPRSSKRALTAVRGEALANSDPVSRSSAFGSEIHCGFKHAEMIFSTESAPNYANRLVFEFLSICWMVGVITLGSLLSQIVHFSFLLLRLFLKPLAEVLSNTTPREQKLPAQTGGPVPADTGAK